MQEAAASTAPCPHAPCRFVPELRPGRSVGLGGVCPGPEQLWTARATEDDFGTSFPVPVPAPGCNVMNLAFCVGARFTGARGRDGADGLMICVIIVMCLAPSSESAPASCPCAVPRRCVGAAGLGLAYWNQDGAPPRRMRVRSCSWGSLVAVALSDPARGGIPSASVELRAAACCGENVRRSADLGRALRSSAHGIGAPTRSAEMHPWRDQHGWIRRDLREPYALAQRRPSRTSWW